MAVSVTTNGTLIDDRIAEELSRKNVLYVAISLEGLTEQTNDVLRGKGNFKRTVDGIKILKNRFRSESNRLFLQICLTPINENEIENDIAYFLSGFDGMKVSFCRIHPFGNAANHPEFVMNQLDYCMHVEHILKANPNIRDKFLFRDLNVFEAEFFDLMYGTDIPIEPVVCTALKGHWTLMPDDSVVRCGLLVGKSILTEDELNLSDNIETFDSRKITDISNVEPEKTGFCRRCKYMEKCHPCLINTSNRRYFDDVVRSCMEYHERISSIADQIMFGRKFRFRDSVKWRRWNGWTDFEGGCGSNVRLYISTEQSKKLYKGVNLIAKNIGLSYTQICSLIEGGMIIIGSQSSINNDARRGENRVG